MKQSPEPESFILKWRGDTLFVELRLERPQAGRAAVRTNLGRAAVSRREIIDETERGITPLDRAWTDLPMTEVEPGRFVANVRLDEVGVFAAKPCFFPAGSNEPEWPAGGNFRVKVESELTQANNSIYCVFPRQFGSFRAIVRRLDHIMGKLGFRIVQTLPPFPVPTTYAVMGDYGCPFAATDFLSVDPAMAEFDEFATPLDQFRELIDAVHARGGLFFIDLPANHTGWASTLQTHHPDWFTREPDGRFHSPGAWGVKWADLVELDYTNAALRAYMADVFLFWCRNGVDGFRCDAGYMIPAATWRYIVARVRDEFPDTVFMLEGLGGKLEVTDALLAEANLDWAYSEIFQTYDRGQFEWYLPNAIRRAQTYGTLVHFAETHDNDRLAKGGAVYARLRVQLAALLSCQGAWGMANGVEWYATEKIDVHGKNDLNWGAADNMVELIARLNHILATNAAFAGKSQQRVVTRGDGNTLAVVRDDEDAPPCLLLANLDCGAAATIDWDRAAFPHASGTDLVTGLRVELAGAVRLAPGEVKCVQADAAVGATIRDPFAIRDAEVRKMPVRRDALFHWVFPRDLKRVVAVPAGQRLEVLAEHPFRVALVDPETGRTLAALRSREAASEFAVLTLPVYTGDGTACRRLQLKLEVYTPEGARRTVSTVLVPPSGAEAKMVTTLSGERVRQHPEGRTILSNGAGAAAQLRLGWGTIASQYDALLAANPNPNVPSDRLTLWTRTRCWLQREGYMRQLDALVVTSFAADPAGRFAQWKFHVPCGMGKTADFLFEVALAEGRNAARLKVTRLAGDADDVDTSVRLVFRPDLEWRSFHATTKAYQEGREARYREASHPLTNGVRFAPYDGAFELTVKGGAYHHEPQWNYNVAHPEEAARGQEGAGDLFSPGWISADLRVGDVVELLGVYQAERSKGEIKNGEIPFLTLTSPLDLKPSSGRLPDALAQSIQLYIVKRDELKTVLAGYPWFLDWGRDTFIFMRGMIAAGLVEDALKILQAFAAFEENGTLPNIIYGQTAGNRDTTDAQLWFVRCVQELELKLKEGQRPEVKGQTEDDQFHCLTSDLGPLTSSLWKTCESIVDNYLKGTPNGIHVDPESALVWSPSHFTWMDTNYPACTPRVGYPVEIQALWISALKYLGRDEFAAKALASVKKYFSQRQECRCPVSYSDRNANASPFGYYDCLSAPNGEPAAQAVPEDTIRPNQLFLITLGILKDPSILRATEELLVPGGLRSLNAEHPLYRGVYAGDEDTARKPAYHNGTVWAWTFPLYAEALAMCGACAPDVALSLLASAVENLNAGCLCHLSENADGDAPHAQKGCTAQAWSDSELLRVWLKLEHLR